MCDAGEVPRKGGALKGRPRGRRAPAARVAGAGRAAAGPALGRGAQRGQRRAAGERGRVGARRAQRQRHRAAAQCRQPDGAARLSAHGRLCAPSCAAGLQRPTVCKVHVLPVTSQLRGWLPEDGEGSVTSLWACCIVALPCRMPQKGSPACRQRRSGAHRLERHTLRSCSCSANQGAPPPAPRARPAPAAEQCAARAAQASNLTLAPAPGCCGWRAGACSSALLNVTGQAPTGRLACAPGANVTTVFQLALAGPNTAALAVTCTFVRPRPSMRRPSCSPFPLVCRRALCVPGAPA